MNPAKSVIWLSLVVMVLGVAAAGAGLFWTTEGAVYPFTTIHGATVDIYGRGVYATDTVFKSGANRGGDVTTLVLAAPVLLLALLYYRRGSIRGAIVLLAALTHFLYVYATLALGAAYNALFLVYVAIFGCSFYAWLLLLFALLPVTSRFAPTLPARGIGVFLLVCGLLTSFLWLEPLLSALARGAVPALLGPNTTMITEALDLALVVPACYVAGVLLLRRDRRGRAGQPQGQRKRDQPPAQAVSSHQATLCQSSTSAMAAIASQVSTVPRTRPLLVPAVRDRPTACSTRPSTRPMPNTCNQRGTVASSSSTRSRTRASGMFSAKLACTRTRKASALSPPSPMPMRARRR